jgi:23S rRNA pseudouridine1911/1915/1917 synthase
VAAELIRSGAVLVDHAVVTQRSLRLDVGMRVTFAPTERTDTRPAGDPDVEIRVVYSDEHIAVVDKQAGLVVHPGAGRPDKTMVNGLLARFPEIAKVGDPERPGIVHRLDADTSGLLVVALSQTAYETLVAALSDHDVERTYVAVVDGVVADDRGVIDAPIGRSSQRRTRMAVVADGREARTHYEVLARRHDAPAASLLRCRLETGRTHQIRVHLAAIGHPVLGDPTYGTALSKAAFARVALHALELGLVHPVTGEAMSFQAPLPPDIEELLSGLALTAS